MRPNPVRRKLAQGEYALGTMVFEFNSPGLARLAAGAGAEFVIFDMEHTGWSVETIRTLIATARCVEIVPIVRVPATEYHFIARVLDVGAMGLMIPMVETAEQAREIVAAAKYPPRGRRGAAFSVAHDDYAGGDIVEKMRSANEEVVILALIETATGIANAEEIAAVPGIDILWMGQFDLTNSLGIPGQFTHPQFLKSLERLVAAAKSQGKSAGIMGPSVDEIKLRIQQGFRALCYGGDLWIYQQALRQGIEGVRGLLNPVSKNPTLSSK